MKFTAYLYRVGKDQHGEGKLVLMISQTEIRKCPELLLIPEETELDVEIKAFYPK